MFKLIIINNEWNPKKLVQNFAGETPVFNAMRKIHIVINLIN